ncbi:MAG: hypothetical protein JJ934_16195 [Pseudomonadales bacterium]|nr:hypothetical protein [Pseudomonadales bacterium]MBO6564595.1 hypothetical protein [Pseudomonadales bacterium]MBO6596873.1 hypothetical protein [Pseudomonadales bacterium]MBO6658434.1 hypothetical protein [Pseudomonadales bacterium]MBO6823138.1 hypothetical protein [Pseudomonadales bacterium]
MNEQAQILSAESALSDDKHFRLVRWVGKFGRERAFKLVASDTTALEQEFDEGITLYDLRLADVMLNYYEAADSLALEIDDLKRPMRLKLALLVTGDLGRGLARMFLSLAKHSYHELEIFDDDKVCLKWLGFSGQQLESAKTALKQIEIAD